MLCNGFSCGLVLYCLHCNHAMAPTTCCQKACQIFYTRENKSFFFISVLAISVSASPLIFWGQAGFCEQPCLYDGWFFLQFLSWGHSSTSYQNMLVTTLPTCLFTYADCVTHCPGGSIWMANKKKMKQKVAVHAVPWCNTRRYLGSIMEEELKRFIFNWTICFVYSYKKLAATQFLPFKLPF